MSNWFCLSPISFLLRERERVRKCFLTFLLILKEIIIIYYCNSDGMEFELVRPLKWRVPESSFSFSLFFFEFYVLLKKEKVNPTNFYSKKITIV